MATNAKLLAMHCENYLALATLQAFTELAFQNKVCDSGAIPIPSKRWRWEELHGHPKIWPRPKVLIRDPGSAPWCGGGTFLPHPSGVQK